MRDIWDKFVEESFVGEYNGLSGDYAAWLRLKDLSWCELDRTQLDRYFQQWTKSKRKGKHQRVVDRRRRDAFGPGRFWAPTSAGVFLNKNFVKGWGGINPVNP